MLIFVCVLADLILGFCYSNLTRETDGLALASTITLVLEANQLTKGASNPYCRRLYTTFDAHILPSTAKCYFRRLYRTFDGYIRLSAL